MAEVPGPRQQHGPGAASGFVQGIVGHAHGHRGEVIVSDVHGSHAGRRVQNVSRSASQSQDGRFRDLDRGIIHGQEADLSGNLTRRNGDNIGQKWIVRSTGGGATVASGQVQGFRGTAGPGDEENRRIAGGLGGIGVHGFDSDDRPGGIVISDGEQGDPGVPDLIGARSQLQLHRLRPFLCGVVHRRQDDSEGFLPGGDGVGIQSARSGGRGSGGVVRGLDSGTRKRRCQNGQGSGQASRAGKDKPSGNATFFRGCGGDTDFGHAGGGPVFIVGSGDGEGKRIAETGREGVSHKAGREGSRSRGEIGEGVVPMGVREAILAITADPDPHEWQGIQSDPSPHHRAAGISYRDHFMTPRSTALHVGDGEFHGLLICGRKSPRQAGSICRDHPVAEVPVIGEGIAIGIRGIGRESKAAIHWHRDGTSGEAIDDGSHISGEGAAHHGHVEGWRSGILLAQDGEMEV